MKSRRRIAFPKTEDRVISGFNSRSNSGNCEPRNRGPLTVLHSSKPEPRMSLVGQKHALPHRNSNRRFTSDSGHHQHPGWEGFGCRWPVGLTRLALAVFHAPALAMKGCRIAPTCTCVHTPPRAVRTLRSLSFAAMAVGQLATADRSDNKRPPSGQAQRPLVRRLAPLTATQ
jgi:hypothetical protein